MCGFTEAVIIAKFNFFSHQKISAAILREDNLLASSPNVCHCYPTLSFFFYGHFIEISQISRTDKINSPGNTYTYVYCDWIV